MNAYDRMSIKGVLRTIRDAGWAPGSIIDLGFATGTKGLLSTWPDAHICLVEPSPSSLVYMQQVAEKFPHVHIYNVGASNRTGETIGARHESLVYAMVGQRKPGWIDETFKVMTCDDIVRDAALPPPFIYKLDTDTHEREVLEGSSETLAQSELCIVEVNVFNAARDRITPDELWRTLVERGSALLDMAGASYAPSGVMRTMDLVFARQGGEVFNRLLERSRKGQEVVDQRVEEQRQALKSNGAI